MEFQYFSVIDGELVAHFDIGNRHQVRVAIGVEFHGRVGEPGVVRVAARLGALVCDPGRHDGRAGRIRYSSKKAYALDGRVADLDGVPGRNGDHVLGVDRLFADELLGEAVLCDGVQEVLAVALWIGQLLQVRVVVDVEHIAHRRLVEPGASVGVGC